MNIPIPFPHVKDMPDYILVPKIKDKVPLETAEFFYGDAGRMFINLCREYKQYCDRQ